MSARNKRCSVILLIVLLLGACTPQTPMPEGLLLPSSTPLAAPTSTAAPVFTPTEASQAASLLYENSDFGLSFRYPASFRLSDQPAPEGTSLWLGLSMSGDNGTFDQYEPALALVIYDNPQQQPLFDWFSSYWGDPPEYGKRPEQPVVFLSPRIENQNPVLDHAALQYESGAWPIRFETLIDQGAWVIGLYYHRDHPVDYEPAYQAILDSLVLSPPEKTVQPAASPPPEPLVCLDANAQPKPVPQRTEPLEVRFIRDGDLWVWMEDQPEVARQITSTGGVTSFHYSPDGQVIAFRRRVDPNLDIPSREELWAVNSDGSQPRRLVSAEEFDAMVPEHPEFWLANVPTNLTWLPGTHRLTFGVYQWFDAVGGSDAPINAWVVDADTLERQPWQPADPDRALRDRWNEPVRLPSPDGQVQALFWDTSLDLVRADGSLIRKQALTYPRNGPGEGPYWSAPQAAWTPDSRFLRVLVPNASQYGQAETVGVWQVPADGSPAVLLHTFEAMLYSHTFTPGNPDIIAYGRAVKPTSNQWELHLAHFDGSQDVLYASGYLLTFHSWAPDAYHFTYTQSGTGKVWLGGLCEPGQLLIDAPGSEVWNLTWLDARRFLYVQSNPAERRQLRLGEIGKESILISDIGETGGYYEILSEVNNMIGLR